MEGPTAIVIDEATGKKWSYGIEALKRIEAERLEAPDHA